MHHILFHRNLDLTETIKKRNNVKRFVIANPKVWTTCVALRFQTIYGGGNHES